MGRNDTKGAEHDPLIAALLGKLPQAGRKWKTSERQAWLTMLAMAFDVVYGAAGPLQVTAGALLETPAGDVEAHDQPKGETVGGAGKPAKPNLALVASSVEPEYYIDKDGFARRDPGGVRIKVGDVPGDETIWDRRPEGMQDLDSITWADGQWPAAALPSLNIASG